MVEVTQPTSQRHKYMYKDVCEVYTRNVVNSQLIKDCGLAGIIQTYNDDLVF